MRTALIVARADNGVIGIDNQLPWHLPCDLKYFKRVTLGKPVIMGRKTFESIGRPLPGRTNVVVTRNSQWWSEGVHIVGSIEDALKLSRAKAHIDATSEVMVIGGATLYREAMDVVDRLYVTQVHINAVGDAFFDAPDSDVFARSASKSHAGDDVSPAHSYEVWDRIIPD